LKSYASWIVAVFLLVHPVTGWTQESAEEWFSKGIQAVKTGEYEEAIHAFRESLALRPDHEDTHRHLGLVYIMQGMWDEGIEAYRKALEINDTNPQTHYDLGFSLYKKGRLEEAVEEFKRAIELNGDFVSAYQALGAVYAENETLEKAIPQFKKAMELSPGDPAVHWNLAEAYSESGRKILAADHYYHVGVLSLERGDREAALGAYEKALPLSSEIAALLLERLYPTDYLPKGGRSISADKPSKDKADKPAIVIGPFPSTRVSDPWYRLKSRMNVRKGPSIDSEIVGKLSRGDKFQIVEEAEGNDAVTSWYRIKGETGTEGWLCGIYKGVVEYETLR